MAQRIDTAICHLGFRCIIRCHPRDDESFLNAREASPE
jgi:hypothetical protein